MPEHCKNCNAELFTGARFCRFCGTRTGPLTDEELPTQVMPGGPAPATATAPSSGTTTTRTRTDTNPVAAPQVSYPAPVPFPARTRSPWGWILTFAGIGLFAIIFFAVLFMARSARDRDRGPRFPPGVSADAERGETALDETDAVVSGIETAFTRQFPLMDDGTVAVTNLNGRISVEAWERPQVELKVIKRGGSERDRKAVQVKYAIEDNKLTVRSAGRLGPVSVQYELKVPRELKKVLIKSTNSDVKLSGVIATLEVEVTNGSLELEDIYGGAIAKVGNGNIAASFEGVALDEPLKFTAVNGNIKLRFKSDVDLDLEAETRTGRISIDERFGVSVVKGFIGQRVKGQIGNGGQDLTVKTVNGNIEIAK